MDMIEAIEKFIEAIKADYAKNSASGLVLNRELPVSYEIGRKFVKIVADRSCFGFIVINDDGKFKSGDILKAASWAAPAKNFARGNIFNIDSYKDKVRWCGY